MKLSVVIPVYNEMETIKEIVNRVQSVPQDKEIVIVDDRSTDGTSEYLSQISDDNITVLYHRQRSGAEDRF